MFGLFCKGVFFGGKNIRVWPLVRGVFSLLQVALQFRCMGQRIKVLHGREHGGIKTRAEIFMLS